MKLIDVVEMRNRINKMIIVDKERDVLSHLEHLRDCIGSNLKDKSFVQSLAESHDKIVEEIIPGAKALNEIPGNGVVPDQTCRRFVFTEPDQCSFRPGYR